MLFVINSLHSRCKDTIFFEKVCQENRNFYRINVFFIIELVISILKTIFFVFWGKNNLHAVEKESCRNHGNLRRHVTGGPKIISPAHFSPPSKKTEETLSISIIRISIISIFSTTIRLQVANNQHNTNILLSKTTTFCPKLK